MLDLFIQVLKCFTGHLVFNLTLAMRSDKQECSLCKPYLREYKLDEIYYTIETANNKGVYVLA